MALLDLPSGSIIAWDNSAVPAGWNLCDGTNGTPDLRDKFVYGANNDGEVGLTGGSDTHTHTSPSTQTVANHDHGGSESSSESGGSSEGVNVGTGTIKSSVGHSHNFSASIYGSGGHSHTVGVSGAASSIPQHVVRSFIRKT